MLFLLEGRVFGPDMSFSPRGHPWPATHHSQRPRQGRLELDLHSDVDVRQSVAAVVVARLLLLLVARRRAFFPFLLRRAAADRADSVCGTCGLDRRDRAHAAACAFAVSSAS